MYVKVATVCLAWALLCGVNDDDRTQAQVDAKTVHVAVYSIMYVEECTENTSIIHLVDGSSIAANKGANQIRNLVEEAREQDEFFITLLRLRPRKYEHRLVRQVNPADSTQGGS